MMKKWSESDQGAVLVCSDRQSLLAGEWLTDAIINCAQTLLKRSYPKMGGLQLGNTLAHTIERGEFVQIRRIIG